MSERTPTEKRISLVLWIGGGLLWTLVGVMILAGIMRDDEHAQAAQGVTAKEDVVAFTEDGVPPPPKSIDGGGLVEPASAWDPKGIGDFSLTERSGETVTQDDLLGKPWIVSFIFTRCAGPCPRVSGQMALLQDQLEEQQIRLVTMTVDPDYDTPEVLTRYAKAFGAQDDWLFLTGEKEKMYRYIEEHFKMPVEEVQGPDRKPGFQVIHTTNLLLIDAQGVVQGAYNAMDPAEMAKLKKDARDLAKDKRETADKDK